MWRHAAERCVSPPASAAGAGVCENCVAVERWLPAACVCPPTFPNCAWALREPPTRAFRDREGKKRLHLSMTIPFCTMGHARAGSRLTGSGFSRIRRIRDLFLDSASVRTWTVLADLVEPALTRPCPLKKPSGSRSPPARRGNPGTWISVPLAKRRATMHWQAPRQHSSISTGSSPCRLPRRSRAPSMRPVTARAVSPRKALSLRMDRIGTSRSSCSLPSRNSTMAFLYRK